MQCETDVLFSSNFDWFSVSLTLSVKDRGVGGGLLNRQNPLSVTKVICRRSLSYLTQKIFSLLTYWILPFSSGLIFFWFSYLTQQVVQSFVLLFLPIWIQLFVASLLSRVISKPASSYALHTGSNSLQVEELHIWQFNDVMFFFRIFKVCTEMGDWRSDAIAQRKINNGKYSADAPKKEHVVSRVWG